MQSSGYQREATRAEALDATVPAFHHMLYLGETIRAARLSGATDVAARLDERLEALAARITRDSALRVLPIRPLVAVQAGAGLLGLHELTRAYPPCCAGLAGRGTPVVRIPGPRPSETPRPEMKFRVSRLLVSSRPHRSRGHLVDDASVRSAAFSARAATSLDTIGRMLGAAGRTLGRVYRRAGAGRRDLHAGRSTTACARKARMSASVSTRS